MSQTIREQKNLTVSQFLVVTEKQLLELVMLLLLLLKNFDDKDKVEYLKYKKVRWYIVLLSVLRKKRQLSSGFSHASSENAAVLIDSTSKNPIGSRVLGPVTDELKKSGFGRIINMSPPFHILIKMSRLRQHYKNNLTKELAETFEYTDASQLPMVDKIIVNCGLKSINFNDKLIHPVLLALKGLTGQRPKITRSSKDNANLKNTFRRDLWSKSYS